MSTSSPGGLGNSTAVGGLPPAPRHTEAPVAAPAQAAAPAQVATVSKTVPTPEPSQEEVKSAVAKVQQAVQAMASDLHFSVDQESGKTIVTLTDAKTGDVIRQMPSKEMVELARNIDRIQGMLLKQKA